MIKAEALSLGFFACGISKVRFLEEEVQNFEKWLNNGMHAEMSYMERNFEKRLDPGKLVPGSKSVVSLLHNYYPEEIQKYENAPVLSKYAYGEDYHFVLKDKMNRLMHFIESNIGKVEGRIFTDSAPVSDKKWAELSGLGWRGKNSNLISKKGSFYFIGELIIDLDLEYDKPIKNYCGTCTRCIDSCPTGAIVEPYVVDARKCISYLTIELKGEIPDDMTGTFRNRVFGCDICQDVCPYNNKSITHKEPRFTAQTRLLNMTRDDWYMISEKDFNDQFKRSALMRTKYSGLKRNLDFLKK